MVCTFTVPVVCEFRAHLGGTMTTPVSCACRGFSRTAGNRIARLLTILCDLGMVLVITVFRRGRARCGVKSLWCTGRVPDDFALRTWTLSDPLLICLVSVRNPPLSMLQEHTFA